MTNVTINQAIAMLTKARNMHGGDVQIGLAFQGNPAVASCYEVSIHTTLPRVTFRARLSELDNPKPNANIQEEIVVPPEVEAVLTGQPINPRTRSKRKRK